jgi:uncharacterized protein YfaP (DUF2135 family)
MIKMTNKEIADKIYFSYFGVEKGGKMEDAKKHANALIDAQVQLMFQDEGTVIIDIERELYLDDWEEIKYLINTKTWKQQQ